MTSTDYQLTPIGNVVSDMLKEISRRAELRPRLEAELGRVLSDEEFIKLADDTGLPL